MATKPKAKRASSRRKKRLLPPGTGTDPVPFWWPPQIPYAPPVGVSYDTWWRMCQNAIADVYYSLVA